MQWIQVCACKMIHITLIIPCYICLVFEGDNAQQPELSNDVINAEIQDGGDDLKVDVEELLSDMQQMLIILHLEYLIKFKC